MLGSMTSSATSDGTRPLGPDFPAPMDDRYFEDYHPGETYEYGHVLVTEQDIIDFARTFDPQPIHTDPEYAVTGPFGGLIASGWHSAGIMMRLIADHYLSRVASLASPGVDELRWPSPLRPGDSVRARVTIVESRPSRSKPDRGIVRTEARLLTQDDRIVLQFVAINLVRLRNPAA